MTTPVIYALGTLTTAISWLVIAAALGAILLRWVPFSCYVGGRRATARMPPRGLSELTPPAWQGFASADGGTILLPAAGAAATAAKRGKAVEDGGPS